jgi:hypothetical protein
VSNADANPDYWSEYSNLQKVKHELIHEYLKGWFPKMALGPSGSRKLIYMDTHAGRGTHLTDELGSPLVALTTLIDHTARDQVLRNTKMSYVFIERDEDNLGALRSEMAKLQLPPNVVTDAMSGDCYQIIESTIASYENRGQHLPPAFIFVDPYGFKVPGKLLRKLISFPRVELFVNVIWRELDMAICQFLPKRAPEPAPVRTSGGGLFDQCDVEPAPEPTRRRPPESNASLAATLDSVFDGDAWRKIDAADSDGRAEQCADILRRMTGAGSGTHLRMLDNGRVRYFLLHLTKHNAGRDLIKTCMWKVCPGGGFSASKSDNPRQVVLIQPEPDLRPLYGWVREKLAAGPKRWHALADDIREELWLKKHMNQVLRSMRASEALHCEGKFAETHNPLLSLAAVRV